MLHRHYFIALLVCDLLSLDCVEYYCMDTARALLHCYEGSFDTLLSQAAGFRLSLSQPWHNNTLLAHVTCYSSVSASQYSCLLTQLFHANPLLI
jgi:hypothetical protein